MPHSFVQCQHVQLVHDARAHLHQPMPMPEQLPQIPIFLVRYPDSWKAVFHQESLELNSCWLDAAAFAQALRRVRACSVARLNSFSVIPASLSLRESCMRETCTCSLSGGRRPARKRASSDPTAMNLRKVAPALRVPTSVRILVSIGSGHKCRRCASKCIYSHQSVSTAN